MSTSKITTIAIRSTIEERYFPFPYSADSLSPVFRAGLIPVVVLAMMSTVSVLLMLACITRRYIFSRTHHRMFVGYNQYVILIYQLLLADLQQSIAFAISIHWLKIDKILAPTASCFLQAWFLHIGNISSGFFVLAIAIHTWLGVVKGYKVPYSWFIVSIVLIWLVSLALTVAGPAVHGNYFFTQVGGWCWVSSEFQQSRLYLHYLWIFIVEFGTVATYGYIFVHLRGRINSITNNDTTRLTRATKFMILYPAVYVILTSPIAIGRMVAMAGIELPDVFFCIAGSFLTSCGWIDALLYTFTRRILNDGMGSSHYSRNLTAITTNPLRPGDTQDFGLQSTSSRIPITAVARTVTITGGGGSGGGNNNSLSSIMDHRRGRTLTRSPQLEKEFSHGPSPMSSHDTLTKPLSKNRINIITETDVRIETASMDFSESILQSIDCSQGRHKAGPHSLAR